MRVIFLDIDGVLNCKSTPNPRRLPYIVDPILLERLKRLITLTDANIVLASTWRYDPAGTFSAKYWGIPFVDVIPDMPQRPRRDENIAWLEAHPEVERYVVIDDEDDELDDLPLFQPSSRTGLSDEIVEAAVAYLTGRSDRDMRRSWVERVFQNVYTSIKGHEG